MKGSYLVECIWRSSDVRSSGAALDQDLRSRFRKRRRPGSREGGKGDDNLAFLATAIPWVTVPGGIWTRIAMGPLVGGVPLQTLELATSAGPGVKVSWTLDGYNAAPPFYERDMGTTFAVRLGTTSAAGIPQGSTARVVWFLASPWCEFWLLTNVGCLAHMQLY